MGFANKMLFVEFVNILRSFENPFITSSSTETKAGNSNLLSIAINQFS